MSKITDSYEILRSIHDLDVDVESRRLYLIGEINEIVAIRFLKNLQVLERSDEPVEMIIHSPGGHVEDGWLIYNAIKTSKLEITGVVYSKAHSAASFVLQACDKRAMHQNATMLIHPGDMSVEGHTLNVINAAMDEKKNLEIMYDVYYERMRDTVEVAISLRQFKQYFSLDKSISATKALEIGLIDRIINE